MRLHLRPRLRKLLRLVRRNRPNLADFEAAAAKASRRFFPLDQEKRFDAIVADLEQQRNFGGWALSINALRAFCGCVEKLEHPRVLEFGSGISTILLDRYLGSRLTMDSFDHSAEYAEKIRAELTNPNVILTTADLWQFDDADFIRLLRGETPTENVYAGGRPLARSLYDTTRVANVFYRIDKPLRHYDAMILDGPHGNGRSLAFNLVRGHVTSPALILIDDCNHYEFVYDCSRFFRFNILQGEIYPAKRWVLLEIHQPTA